MHIDMLSLPHAGVRNHLVYLRPLLKQAVRKWLPIKTTGKSSFEVGSANSVFNR